MMLQSDSVLLRPVHFIGRVHSQPSPLSNCISTTTESVPKQPDRSGGLRPDYVHAGKSLMIVIFPVSAAPQEVKVRDLPACRRKVKKRPKRTCGDTELTPLVTTQRDDIVLESKDLPHPGKGRAHLILLC